MTRDTDQAAADAAIRGEGDGNEGIGTAGFAAQVKGAVDATQDLTGDMVKLAQPVGERALAAAGYRAINGHAIAFDRLERLSDRVYRLSEKGALKWDAALAAALDVPQELVRPLLNEIGYVADGKREEESYKRRRQVRAAPVPPPDPNSPFAALARLRETPR